MADLQNTLNTRMSSPVDNMTKISQNISQMQQDANKGVTSAELAYTTYEQQQIEAEAERQNKRAEKYQKDRDELKSKMNWEHPTFHPTQDNLTELATLFSFIGIAGALAGGGGRNAGMNALSSMTGMLEGWKEGSKERFVQEKAVFDENLKVLEKQNQAMAEQLKLYQEEFVNDRQASQDRLAIIKATNPYAGKVIEAKGAVGAAAYEQQLLDNNLKIAKFKQDQEKINIEREKQRRLAAGGGRTSAIIAGRAENIREAFVQGAQDLINVTKFPKTTVLGTFAGMTGQSGGTLTSSLSNSFARQITDPESRMFQQLVSGLETNAAMALGGGYATSASKNRIDQYKQQLPQKGDSAEVAAMFLARMKQEFNILAENFPSKPGASPEMNSAVQTYNDRINQAIPFNVDDVLTAQLEKRGKGMSEDKRKRLLELEQKAGQ